MTDKEIRNITIEVFNKIRSTPNATYDEEYFMDYLIDPPTGKNSIKNSFKGARKYYDFMREIELIFSICFSYKDLDKCYSVERIRKKIQDKIQKHQSNVILIKARKAEKNKYYLDVILTIILIILAVWLKAHWITFTYGVVYILIIFWLNSARIKDKRHTNQLFDKIMSLNKKNYS